MLCIFNHNYNLKICSKEDKKLNLAFYNLKVD